MDKALQTMVENMPEKTGKSLNEWSQILASKKFDKHSAAVAFLKNEYNVSHGYANTIVTLSGGTNSDQDDLVAQQYANKPELRPIYDKLLMLAQSLGDDVEVAPKKTSVSLRRKRQFALIQPSTRTRVDLGLKFDNKPIRGRLEGSGPFGSMCTHRVQLTDISQIDSELAAWLRQAYDEAT